MAKKTLTLFFLLSLLACTTTPSTARNKDPLQALSSIRVGDTFMPETLGHADEVTDSSIRGRSYRSFTYHYKTKSDDGTYAVTEDLSDNKVASKFFDPAPSDPNDKLDDFLQNIQARDSLVDESPTCGYHTSSRYMFDKSNGLLIRYRMMTREIESVSWLNPELFQSTLQQLRSCHP